MIWYVPTLSFDEQQPFPCTQRCRHPPHFPKYPTTQLHPLSHQDCMYANLRCSKSTSPSTWMPRLHLHTSWFPAHQSTYLPARPMLCSHARSSERMRRYKGLGEACCEAPVGQTTAGIAGAAAAATSLNALVDGVVVGFLCPHRTHTLEHTSAFCLVLLVIGEAYHVSES